MDDAVLDEKKAPKKRPLTRRAKRHRYGTRSADQPGMSPGQLIPDPNAEPTVIDIVGYGPSEIVEKKNVSLDELLELRKKFHCLWIDIHGLRDVAIIERLGTEFSLHPLALEDVVSSRQRAKVEEYPNNLFVVARMVNPGGSLETEQFSIFVGMGCAISFQATASNMCASACANSIREFAIPTRIISPTHCSTR